MTPWEGIEKNKFTSHSRHRTPPDGLPGCDVFFRMKPHFGSSLLFPDTRPIALNFPEFFGFLGARVDENGQT